MPSARPESTRTPSDDWLAQREDGAAGGQEPARRVLGVDAGLDRVPGRRRRPGHRKAFARGHPQLPLDQVQPVDELGDRVLDLEPGVHLHEVELVGGVAGHDELDRAGPGVADAARRLDGGAAHGLAAHLVEQRRRGLFDDLLVAPLQAALALAEVRHGAVGVREDLDLDVPGAGDVPLDEQRVVAERGAGLPPGRRERGGQFAGGADHAHALAAPSGGGFDEEGKHGPVQTDNELFIGHAGLSCARYHRNAGRGHRRLRGDLVAHRLDRGGRRADEHQAGGGAGAGEGGVLREEAVAGMHGFRPGRARGGDDRVDVQVAVRRRAAGPIRTASPAARTCGAPASASL